MNQNILMPRSTSSDNLPRQPSKKVSHLPGPKGHWLLGNAPALMPNPGPFLAECRAKYGDCFTVGVFRNQRALIMAGPEANELVLRDPDNNFSSRWGWEVLHAFFGRNVLVRDFEDHRQHRRLMNHVFKPGALADYLEQMNPIIDSCVDQWAGGVNVYRTTKQMALDIAVEVFAGVPAGDTSETWNRDLNLVLSNAMAHRIRLPGTPYWRGLRARDRLRDALRRELPRRREANAPDLFSQLANQRDDDGATLSDDDVIDHMFGMLFAAHDTTASALAMMFWLLAKHPDWQRRAYEECIAVQRQTGNHLLEFEDLDKLPVTEAIFLETLRLYAPIQILPRRGVQAFEFQGHAIPENAWIMLIPQLVHGDPQWYPSPESFNPGRFLNQKPDTYTFVPFGRGSHMCLGMHFAHMEIKAVLYALLLRRELHPAREPAPTLEYLPLVRPTTPMIVQFSER